MTEPTLEPMEDMCQMIGDAIGRALDNHAQLHPDHPRIGFTLLLFTLGEGGWMTYISNSERESMIEAMQEFIAKQPTEREDR